MRRTAVTLLLAATLVAIKPAAAEAAVLGDIVPAPVTVQPAAGVSYTFAAGAAIYAGAGAAEEATYLASLLRLPIASSPASISLLLNGAVGGEGYQLDVTSTGVTIAAQTKAGLFHGIQTLRQLLPPTIENGTSQPAQWTIPGGRIVDYPRFAYRGAMLDVARHFQPVSNVKRYLDQIALYKINTFHFHLSDDQGWRIVIDGWPRLTTVGGSTQVGGGAGGFYTKAQYQDIVAYAAQRHITVVPEIDMPGHTNAALASYAELNCNGVAPPLYTGTGVGFSNLCTSKEVVYTFVQNVLTELAAITPGPYLHLGGDEADTLTPTQYATFMNRVQPMIPALGKTVIGWHQIAPVQHSPNRIMQYWGTTTSDSQVTNAVSRGARVVLSPANKAYLDMKYTSSTPIGQSWAGLIEVQTAYEWNPGAYLSGVAASAVLGVEAPLWSETIVTADHIEFMAFPRLPALAELGWSPWSTHSWTAFRQRLGLQGPRWTLMGIDFYRSPQVPWAALPGPGGRFEAENATISQGVVDSNHAGFSGTGFVNYDNASGSYVEWALPSAASMITIRYANGTTTNRRMNVNGTLVDFPGTGSWTTWVSKSVAVSGSIIRATATTSAGGPNVDYLEVNS